MNTTYLKVNRIFNPYKKYAWLFIGIVALGGLWVPKLGLLMIPLMIGLLVGGFFKGKYWCGNVCPHGSLFDQFVQPFSVNKKIPGLLRSTTFKYLFFAWFMTVLTVRLTKVFSLWGTISFLDKLGYIFVMNYVMVTVLGTAAALFIAPRAWCTFCPMGTFQGLSRKLGRFTGLNRGTEQKIMVTEGNPCVSCGKCSRVCPMQLTPHVEFSKNNTFDHEACILCSTCVANCPISTLYLGGQREKKDVDMAS